MSVESSNPSAERDPSLVVPLDDALSRLEEEFRLLQQYAVAEDAIEDGHEGPWLARFFAAFAVTLLLGVVLFATLRNSQPRRQWLAEANLSAVRQAALAYILDGNPDCPTVRDLVEAGEIDAESLESEYSDGTKEYAIMCEGDAVEVRWYGRDRRHDTDDDVTTRPRRCVGDEAAP
ncbi:MAG: hypothetical protein AAGF12_32260 [Myxococcota bacterium]